MAQQHSPKNPLSSAAATQPNQAAAEPLAPGGQPVQHKSPVPHLPVPPPQTYPHESR